VKLTAYAIVRDGEEALGGCVESVKGIADELVIVDTGSSDNTLEVARRYTEHVFVHPRAEEWRDDPSKFRFDEARNWAIERVEEIGCDWILSIDCDERLDPKSAEGLRQALERQPDGADIILVTMVMCLDDGTEYQHFLAERIWRAGRGIRFKGGMHNYLDVPKDHPRVAKPDVRFIHNRAVHDAAKRAVRSEQRVKLAESVLAADDSPRSLFYLAGTLFDAGRREEAIPIFEKHLEKSTWPEERYQGAILLATIHMDAGRFDEARKVLFANMHSNWKRNEAYVMLGKMAKMEGDLEQAEWWLKAASLKPAPVDPLFVDIASHTWVPHTELWEVYTRAGRPDVAEEHAKLAIEQGAPIRDQIRHWQKERVQHGDKRILVCPDRGQTNFIDPVIRHWRKQGKQVKVADGLGELLGLRLDDWDIIWCEWAGEQLAWLTRQPTKARIIVRIHGYDVYTGRLGDIIWERVDDVIFVADYLRETALAQCPRIGELCNVYVVPGGVEVDKFSIGENKTGTKIAMACHGNPMKRIDSALDILAQLPEQYSLHVAVQWQDGRYLMAIEHLVRELGLEERVFFYPWQEDMNKFYADKDFYLSASYVETFHYSLAEGMAAGLKPVIHCWQSSRDFYPDEFIYRTTDEAVRMILDGNGEPQAYRDYAAKWLNVDRNIARIDRIIRRPTVAGVDRVGLPQSGFIYKILTTATRIGAKASEPKPEVVIACGRNTVLPPSMRDAKHRIWWYTEQLIGETPDVEQRRQWVRELAEQYTLILSHSPHQIDLLKELTGKEVVYAPSAAAMYPFRPIKMQKLYDVGFCGAVTPRRKELLDKLGEQFSIAVLNNPDHEQVCNFYNACKVVINIHATEEINLEMRLGEALACGAYVISEPIPDPEFEPHVKIATIDEFPRAIQEALDHPEAAAELGMAAGRWIRRHRRFEHVVEQVLDKVGA